MLSELLLTDEGRGQLALVLEAERPPVRYEPHNPPSTSRRVRVPVWQDYAACAEHPGAMDVTRGPAARAALALCAQCPVTAQCAAWLDDELDYVGVAAGRVISTSAARARAGAGA